MSVTSTMGVKSKYDELRFKTDLQLLRLAHAQLDLGIDDAREALQSAENLPSARCHYRLAEAAHSEAARLIRLTGSTGDFGQNERMSADARLTHLREMLDGLSVLSAPAMPASDKTPALARALWKAKGCPEGSAEDDWFQAERVLQSHAACVAG